MVGYVIVGIIIGILVVSASARAWVLSEIKTLENSTAFAALKADVAALEAKLK